MIAWDNLGSPADVTRFSDDPDVWSWFVGMHRHIERSIPRNQEFLNKLRTDASLGTESSYGTVYLRIATRSDARAEPS